MIKVAICICTRRRQDGLMKLLGSFDSMKIPVETTVRIVVVENDRENRSEQIVRAFSQESKLKVDYYLETQQGLVYARNRSVKEAGDCDFCCFTDDDEIVEVNWLSELLLCQAEFNADGVSGITNPLFGKKVSSYIHKFHQADKYPYGTIIESAFTGCLLVRKKHLDMLDGPFNVKLNFSGGEDSYLTKQVTALGGIIRFNPEAIAWEIIPDDRTTIKFVIRRAFRISNTALSIRSLKDMKFKKSSAVPRLILRFGFGLLIIIPYFIFGGQDRLKGLIKLTNAIGGFAFVFGKKSQFYK
jgi:glycosyltransferase involved in cell wall biosynthesis